MKGRLEAEEGPADEEGQEQDLEAGRRRERAPHPPHRLGVELEARAGGDEPQRQGLEHPHVADDRGGEDVGDEGAEDDPGDDVAGDLRQAQARAELGDRVGGEENEADRRQGQRIAGALAAGLGHVLEEREAAHDQEEEGEDDELPQRSPPSSTRCDRVRVRDAEALSGSIAASVSPASARIRRTAP